MPYVERDEVTAIKGLYENLQPGYAEEFLPDNNSEVVAFKNGLKAQTDPPSPQEQARIDTLRTDSTTVRNHLKADTSPELEAYVRGQINADAVTNLATAQQCLKRLETGQVILMKALASLLYGRVRE